MCASVVTLRAGRASTPAGSGRPARLVRRSHTGRMTIPRDDPRAAHMASTTDVERDELDAFVRERYRWILCTERADGRPQMSPVTGGLLDDGRLAVSTYPERAKARNVGRRRRASVLVLGERFDDPWVQVDGDAEVLDLPGASDAFVAYYRSISGDHPDWGEYRRAMQEQGKCLVVVSPTTWSPISTGGFPPSLFEQG